MILNCRECGVHFPKTHSRMSFCSSRCRNNAKMRRWRAKHPEQQKALEKRYRVKNRPVVLQRMRAWYHANKDEQTAKRRAHHHANKDRANARRLAHYFANHEQQKEKKRVNGQKARITVPWRALLHSAEGRAKKKKVPYSLTKEWAIQTWTGRCAVTDIPFKLGLKESGPKAFSPSIDRVIPSLGYVPENCRFVLWMVNAFKYDGTDEDMIAIARAIVEYADLRNTKTSIVSDT